MISLRLDDRLLDELADQLLPRIAARLPKQVEAATPRYLTLSSVGAMIDASRKSLEMRFVRARKNGSIHPLEKLAIEIDGARRWREDDVREWIRGGGR